MGNITIYKSTDVDLTITVAGIDLADVTAVTVTLEAFEMDPVVFTGDSITIGASSINLRIEDDELPSPGIYKVRITMMVDGSLRGLTPSPTFVTVV